VLLRYFRVNRTPKKSRLEAGATKCAIGQRPNAPILSGCLVFAFFLCCELSTVDCHGD
jgi:hypothetical protein